MKKKIEKIYFIIVIIIILTALIIPTQLKNLDEVWNYNFARNTASGLLPYRDFNIIIMPLFPNICAIFLMIFGNEMIIMRILAVILCTGILLMSNKVLEYLKVNKQLRYLFLIFIIYLFYNDFRIDYNFFILLNTIAIIYLEIKRDQKSESYKIDLLMGILAGICICTKQTTGIFICLALILNPILKITNKEETKKYIKQSMYKIIGILIPLIIISIYFTFNKLWTSFIDYSILGIGTFTNKIPYSHLIKENIIIKILSIIVPIFIIVSFIICIIKRKNKKQEYQNLWILTCYSIAEMIVVYPIADKTHFLLGTFPSLIGMMYIISIVVKNIKYKKIKIYIKEFAKAAIFMISIIAVCRYSMIIYQYIKIANNYTNLNHFKYIPIDENLENGIKNITEYIKQSDKKVHILDTNTAIYTISLNTHDKNYDLFQKGNFGKNGETGIIENIKNEEDAVYLVVNDKYSKNWQNPENVEKYVKENLKKIGEIEQYDIYTK